MKAIVPRVAVKAAPPAVSYPHSAMAGAVFRAAAAPVARPGDIGQGHGAAPVGQGPLPPKAPPPGYGAAPVVGQVWLPPKAPPQGYGPAPVGQGKAPPPQFAPQPLPGVTARSVDQVPAASVGQVPAASVGQVPAAAAAAAAAPVWPKETPRKASFGFGSGGGQEPYGTQGLQAVRGKIGEPVWITPRVPGEPAGWKIVIGDVPGDEARWSLAEVARCSAVVEQASGKFSGRQGGVGQG